MSAEARMQGLIEDAVRRATEPLEKAVEELSARLTAVEDRMAPPSAAPAKRAAGGRPAKAKAQPAETTATAEDAEVKPAEAAPSQRKSSE